MLQSTASESSLPDAASTSDTRDPNDESPDLFDTPEDGTLTEVKVQKDETIKKEKRVKSDHEISGPSRLFEEMQRLDERSGKLNLAVPNASSFLPKNIQTNNTDTSMDGVDATRSDPAAELKKRVSRKITDYFSKKST